MSKMIYRGKHVEDGKWAYGWYSPIVFYDGTIIPSIKDTDGLIHQVLPGTVGQYVGKIDVNGKRIFEDDIVVSPQTSPGVVEWEYDLCMYMVRLSEGDYLEPMYSYNYEVIGNIHDNKNILEDKNNV